jgi:fibronectin type 3 domain-containing protein
LANQRDKLASGTYSKKLFSECGDTMKADQELNSIKRMKIDESASLDVKKEKNVLMQQKMKTNLSKDCTVGGVDAATNNIHVEDPLTVNILDEVQLKQTSPRSSQVSLKVLLSTDVSLEMYCSIPMLF